MEEAFAEVVEDAKRELLALPDAPRAEIWVSGVLAVWHQPGVGGDPAEHDREFAGYLLAHPGPPSRAIAVALRGLGWTGVAHVGGDDPPWAAAAGTANAIGAWEVEGSSVVLGFAHDRGPRHSMLVDIEGQPGRIVDLVFGPDPEEVLAGADAVAVEPGAAARRIADAWLEATPQLTDNVLMNWAAGVARLRLLVPGFDPPPPAVAPSAGPPAADEGADRAAVLTLQSALRPSRGAEPPPGATDELVDRLARPLGVPEREREAFDALEWADWLGAVIQLVRAGSGVEVSPSSLVSSVNRCPEITSSIPARDRPYYEWAFSVVLAHWQTVGVVDRDWRLTELGVWLLPRAVARSWGGTFD